MAAKLDEFERAVYGRTRSEDKRQSETNTAVLALLQVLHALKKGEGFEDYPVLNTALFTRFCSAVVALFLDPSFRLTQPGFDAVAAERAIVEAAFAASSYGNSDYVFNLFDEGEADATKYLLLFQTNSALRYDLEAVFRMDPQATFGLYLSLLGYGQVFTQEGDERREQLLMLYPIFSEVELNPGLMGAMAAAYMHCSYAHGADKHAIKGFLHRLVAKQVAQVVSLPSWLPQVRKKRPVIVIPMEWWNSQHAMYRCYAQSIRQLREDFYLIGMAMNADDESKTLFDEWIAVDSENVQVDVLARAILERNPDIIYYPSIGMSPWVVALASVRLAPIQVMTYGHPATSMSPAIDYGILEEDVCVARVFQERMRTLPANSVRFVPFTHAIPAKHTPRTTDTVKIAITAMQVKVTWPLIRCLQEVQKRAVKKVEFHFFGATSGVGLYSFSKTIERMLAGTKVYEKAGYDEYIKWIAQCDICLFSFPFGGTNTCVDAMLMGLPMVVMEGEEPHSRTDSTLIRRAGLPECLIAHSEEEYIERILALTGDDRRIAMAETIAQVDVAKKFFVADGNRAFFNAFRQIYRNNTLEAAA